MLKTCVIYLVWILWGIFNMVLPWALASFIMAEPWPIFSVEPWLRASYLGCIGASMMCTWIVPTLWCDKLKRSRW